MRKFSLSKSERRIVIILMAVNTFALFVNYFMLSPKSVSWTGRAKHEVYWFTDVKAERTLNQDSWTTINGVSTMYETRHPNHFWPFVKFHETFELRGHNRHGSTRFRGIFADFDHTEFLVYTGLIFGFILIRRLW